MSCQRWVLVPCSVNLTGKRDNAGHEKTTVNITVIIKGCHMFSFVFWLFVILVISHFGFEGWIWVLIASVPDLRYFLLLVVSLRCQVWNQSKSKKYAKIRNWSNRTQIQPASKPKPKKSFFGVLAAHFQTSVYWRQNVFKSTISRLVERIKIY